MAENSPSFKGLGSNSKIVIRTTPKQPESKVSTQRPTPTTPSPRGHA